MAFTRTDIIPFGSEGIKGLSISQIEPKTLEWMLTANDGKGFAIRGKNLSPLIEAELKMRTTGEVPAEKPAPASKDKAPKSQAPAKTTGPEAPMKGASFKNLSPAEKQKHLRDLLYHMAPQFDSVLSGIMRPEAYIFAVMASINKNPKILGCEKKTILSAVAYLSIIGLSPDTPDNHAHLIPYGIVCQAQLNYQGLIEVAHRSDRVKKIWGGCVYEGDEYRVVRGTSPSIVHVPCRKSERGKIVGAYACAELINGAIQFETMDEDELPKIRNASKSPNSPAWTTWESEMYKKAAVKRLKKWIPTSRAFSLACAIDDAETLGKNPDIRVPEFEVFDDDIIDDEPKQTKSDALAEKVAGNNDAPPSTNRPKRPPKNTEGEEQQEEMPEEDDSGEYPLDDPPEGESTQADLLDDPKPPESQEEDEGEDEDSLRVKLMTLLAENEAILSPDDLAKYHPERINRWKLNGLRTAYKNVLAKIKEAGGDIPE